MDNVLNRENVFNMDEEDFINMVDEVFGNEEVEMEIDNIDIDIEDEDEEHALSDDSNYVSDQSDDLTDYAEKIVTRSELLALNNNKKHCSIQFYYSTGGALTVCAECMVRLADTDIGIIYAVRKHEIDTLNALNYRFCSNCRQSVCVIMPCNMCPICTA